LDQHDFFVIGVLGTQGVGKSTLMSALARDSQTKYVHEVILPVEVISNGHLVKISATVPHIDFL